MKLVFGFRNLVSSVGVLGAAIVASALLIHSRAVPPAMPFATFNVQVVLNVLGGLFVVALMMERAVEVIISVLRDADAQVLTSAVAATTAALADAKLEVPASATKIEALTMLLSAQKKSIDDYRIDTRETTYCISFTLGVALALVGVRGLVGLLAPGTGPVSGWFKLVDILITGAVIAGGSDGIHKMVKAVLDCFSMISTSMTKKSADITAS
jgi:hypothetical protein